MERLGRLGPKATASIFAAVLAVFLFAWSVIVDDDSVVSSLVGAVVGGLVAGGLFLWIMNIATG